MWGAQEGSTVPLQLAEIGVEGLAEVTAIQPCPAIERGPGRLVTGAVTHRNGHVVRVSFVGDQTVLEVTAAHKLYSISRGGWIEAGQLFVGERLRTVSGDVTVESVEPVAGIHRVYNLEVDADHTYLVSQLGVVAHNNDGCSGGGGSGGGAPSTAREPVRPGDTGTYGDLKAQKRRFGETEPLDMDHQPSFAAQKAAAEKALGRELRPAEARALKAATPAVASPRAIHQQTSPTFAGRNTPERIAEDSADLGAAAARDRAVFDEAVRKR